MLAYAHPEGKCAVATTAALFTMASRYSSAQGVIARTKAEIIGTADTIVRVGARSSFPALVKPLSYAMLSPPILPARYARSSLEQPTCGDHVANPAVALALESGSAPVVVEGHATLLAPPWPDNAIRDFQRKYNWTITVDAEYDTLIAVRPEGWLMAQQ